MYEGPAYDEMTKLNHYRLADMVPCPYCGGEVIWVGDEFSEGAFHRKFKCILCDSSCVQSYTMSDYDEWTRG